MVGEPFLLYLGGFLHNAEAIPTTRRAGGVFVLQSFVFRISEKLLNGEQGLALTSSAKCCAWAQHRHDVDFILSENRLSVKGADATFAAGVVPDGIVQLAQPVVNLRKTIVVGDQRVLFRVSQEGQTADESGLIVVVEVVVVRQIEVRFIYLVPQIGVTDETLRRIRKKLLQAGSFSYSASIWASSSFSSLMSARSVSFSASVRALVLQINAASSKCVKS